MLAAMGKGDESEAVLKRFIDGVKGRYILGSNTMYFEGGGQAEVIETPLSAAQTVHDLLLQSWGDKIRIFPAIPSTWRDVAFANLRAEGAFLISALRRDGKTQWIRIKSLAGEPCRIRVGVGEPMRVFGSTVNQPMTSDGIIALSLKKGEELTLAAAGVQTLMPIEPVKGDGNHNAFGLKATN
jgi:hypothetical protein